MKTGMKKFRNALSEVRPILSALMHSKTSALLIAVQVAISLAILANAMHVATLRQTDAARASGIANESTVFSIRFRKLKSAPHDEQIADQKRYIAALRAVPGVLSAALASQTPMSRWGSTSSVGADDNPAHNQPIAATYESPDSLIQTWGLRLIEGRDFSVGDVLEIDPDASTAFPQAAIISRALAEKLFPDARAALGKLLYFGSGSGVNSSRIVGVVERLQTANAESGNNSEMSLLSPVRLSGNEGTLFTVRTEPGQRERVIKDAEAALRAAAVTPLILKIRRVTDERLDRYRSDHALVWVLLAVCALMLLVTASGIVGVSTLWVHQRRKHIGVRRALGARRMDILRYFIVENLLITTAGIVGGMLLAIALNQVLVAQMEMHRLPPVFLISGAAILLFLGLGAVYAPAWRAASISPATATRTA